MRALTKATTPLTVGSATARPGEIVYGDLPVLDLPSGGQECLPVIIAQGHETGPTLWLTANIHGAELTGLPVIHRVMTADLAGRLRGTVVAIPTLNPAGLRTAERLPYYSNTDPNRLWPTRRPERDPGTPPPNPYEQIIERVFAQFAARADLAIDLHNAAIRTIPFTIIDRVLYRGDADRARATALGERLRDFAGAFGVSVVREAAAERYVSQVLHRSVTGSLVNVLGIPALTVELGMTAAVDPAAVEAGVAGVQNALRWAGMLPGEPAPITACPVVDPGYATKRDDSARARVAGIVVQALQPGECFVAGQTLAESVDIWGRPLLDSAITAPADGWLIGWTNGLAKYAGQTIASLAIRDDAPLVAAYPKG
jgi:predicted deacylase